MIRNLGSVFSTKIPPLIFTISLFLFSIRQDSPILIRTRARTSNRPETGSYSISESLATLLGWNSVWISVAEMTYASWQFFRADFTVMVCRATNQNFVIKYWIACWWKMKGNWYGVREMQVKYLGGNRRVWSSKMVNFSLMIDLNETIIIVFEVATLSTTINIKQSLD